MHRSYISPTGTVTLLLAALVIGASATASARPKKDSAAPSSSSATQCHGTPVIMQGMDCPKYRARGDEQQQATDREKHPRVTVRGSGGIYAAPIQPTPSLTPLPSVTPYVPPAISNP